AEDEYRACVAEQAERLVAITKDPSRIFEVGMRAATCEAQHRICLEVLREKGIYRTSNVKQAQALDMQAVGTMGHEHVQRWGDDLQAFRAMRDMRPGAPSYLLDTFDTIVSGIPAAVQVARERAHPFSIRYDSGDKYAQYLYAHGAFDREDLRPIHIIEDGLDAEATARFEELRRFTGVASDHQIYGYGGYLVSRSWRNPLTRDAVAAVYKLSSTSGAPRMKFGNERGLGKVSIPGEPVVWRRLRGAGPLSVIGQYGEPPPEDYLVLSRGAEDGDEDVESLLRICNVDAVIARTPEVPYTLSPRTQQLMQQLRKDS
ncbi:MAG: nicotinate phosphoribosyltransferase, partial [Nannocystaceae bacterium]